MRAYEADRGLGAWGLPLAIIALSSMVMTALPLVPAHTGPAALVFPPWWNDAQVVAGASRAGRLIRLGGFHFVVVVDRNGDGAAPTQRTGAWMVLNPRVVGGCSPAAARR